MRGERPFFNMMLLYINWFNVYLFIIIQINYLYFFCNKQASLDDLERIRVYKTKAFSLYYLNDSFKKLHEFLSTQALKAYKDDLEFNYLYAVCCMRLRDEEVKDPEAKSTLELRLLDEEEEDDVDSEARTYFKYMREAQKHFDRIVGLLKITDRDTDHEMISRQEKYLACKFYLALISVHKIHQNQRNKYYNYMKSVNYLMEILSSCDSSSDSSVAILTNDEVVAQIEDQAIMGLLKKNERQLSALVEGSFKLSTEFTRTDFCFYLGLALLKYETYRHEG